MTQAIATFFCTLLISLVAPWSYGISNTTDIKTNVLSVKERIEQLKKQNKVVAAKQIKNNTIPTLSDTINESSKEQRHIAEELNNNHNFLLNESGDYLNPHAISNEQQLKRKEKVNIGNALAISISKRPEERLPSSTKKQPAYKN